MDKFSGVRQQQLPYIEFDKRSGSERILGTHATDVYRRSFAQRSVKTPNFKKLNRFTIPENPYDHDITATIYDGCSVIEDWGSTVRYYPPGAPATSWYASGPAVTSGIDVRGEAASKLLAQVKNQKINIAQFSAEAGMTVAMIADTARRLANSFTQLKRFNVVGAFSAWRYKLPHEAYRRAVEAGRSAKLRGISGRDFAANAWLEYSYGWKPLLSDVYGACDYLANTLYNRQLYFRSAASASRNVDRDISRTWTPSIPGTSVSPRSWNARASVRSRFHYVVEYAATSRLYANANALGLTNPLSLAWEVLPYSFVVDWFLPIGSWLNTLDATVGYTFIRGSLTEQHNIDQIWEATYTGQSSPSRGRTYGTVSGSLTRRFKRRTVLNSFPSPSFPRPKNPFSSSHLTSAISLLQQSFGRPGR